MYETTLQKEIDEFCKRNWYDLNSTDSFSAHNAKRQVDAMMPSFERYAQFAKSVYEEAALEKLIVIVDQVEKELKEKYGIK